MYTHTKANRITKQGNVLSEKLNAQGLQAGMARATNTLYFACLGSDGYRSCADGVLYIIDDSEREIPGKMFEMKQSNEWRLKPSKFNDVLGAAAHRDPRAFKPLALAEEVEEKDSNTPLTQ